MEDNQKLKEKTIRRYLRMRIYALLILFLFLGIAIGLLISQCYYKICKANNVPEKEVRLKGYKFISPLVDYEYLNELQNREIRILKQGIQGIIDTKIKEGKILYVSVYFRDLLNGPWLGINEKEGYQPASLMKVPLMIAYLKYAQENPGVLSYELKYEKPVDYGVRQNILPEKELVIGESYTVDELIYRMIVYSDNAAKDILLNSIDSRLIDNVYSDIEFELENDSVVTVKEYASFFRILFNASYLNREMSEKALDILSKSSFKAGIRAGVPSDVVVANKFGEKGDEQNKTFQVHDCGIIYHKYRPYLICIMTDSTSFVDDSNIIREISGFVYQEIDSYYAVRTKK